MSKFIPLAIVMIVCNLSGPSARAQEEQPQAILFHVTAVERADDTAACKTESCSAMKYTVEGFADVHHTASKTQYVITCNEVMNSRPVPHRDNICARFHAGNAYMAELQSDRVSFPHSMLNKAFETDYSIVSEREIPKGPDDRETPGAREPREANNGRVRHEAAKGPEQLASRDNSKDNR